MALFGRWRHIHIKRVPENSLELPSNQLPLCIRHNDRVTDVHQVTQILE